MADHTGKFEYRKFEHRREGHYEALDTMSKMDIQFGDLLEHFPAFIGHMTLSRFLGIYELYKKALGVSGHIAEVGVYKGASFLLFAKLIQIFEHESLTQVHGFDWFEGTGEDSIPLKIETGTYRSSYEQLLELVKVQGLDRTAFVHKLDVTKDLFPFLEENAHMQFKIVFLDAGTYDVVSTALPLLWDRLTPGGIVILDQYNHELSPGETMAVREILPDAKVKVLPNIWMPSGYIIKGE